MKKLNLFAMGLLATAAVSFTACSSNDDLNANGTGSSESKAKGFYMTLTVQTPTSNGSRSDTGTRDTQAGTEAESAITTGTLYLVNSLGNNIFTKTMDANAWKEATETTTGASKTSKTISIEVQYVNAGEPYKVYFLANNTDLTHPYDYSKNVLTATSKFSNPFSNDKSFVMFNENDKTKDGNGYTVTFAEANKDADHPATVKYNNETSPIYLDRLVARIDEPTSGATTITQYIVDADGKVDGKADKTSETYKKAMADALAKVTSVTLQRYAIANLPNKSYAMQRWQDRTAANVDSLLIPSDVTYFQATSEFGDTITANNIGENGFFKAMTTGTGTKQHDYVLENVPASMGTGIENTLAWMKKTTAVYFEYKVTLDATKTGTPDFTDGTFYRFNNIIFTSIDSIMTHYADSNNPFVKLNDDGTKDTTAPGLYTATEAVAKLKAIIDTNDETKLANVRKAWGIEIFKQGLSYYKMSIIDKQLNKYATTRNTIYNMNVTKIYNVGADVPNGKPTEDAYYYMAVDITVNPWILNTQTVIF